MDDYIDVVFPSEDKTQRDANTKRSIVTFTLAVLFCEVIIGLMLRLS